MGFTMRQTMVVAACSLSQCALDWEGNVAHIKQSILVAKSRGAKLRVGPELEVSKNLLLLALHILSILPFSRWYDLFFKCLEKESIQVDDWRWRESG